MTQPAPTVPPAPASRPSLAPRTPWPASGVALRLGGSLALLAATLPLLFHTVLSSETVERLRAETSTTASAAPVRGRFQTSGAATTPLSVSVKVDRNDVNLMASAQSSGAPGLQVVLRGGQASDRLQALQKAGGDVALRVLTGHVVLPSHPGTLEVQVRPDAPLSLELQGGADTHLDLSHTTLRALTLRQDLGETRVRFPAHGEYRADLRTDVGAVSVAFPAGVYTARLHLQADLGAVTVQVPQGARVTLHTVTDLGSVVLPSGYGAAGTPGAAGGPDLTLDLQTDAGRITVQEMTQ